MSDGHCEESEYRGASNRLKHSAEQYVAPTIRCFGTLSDFDLITLEKHTKYLFNINN